MKARRLRTRFWRPGTDPLQEILSAGRGRLRDGDLLVISEKALSTAHGHLVDEGSIRPGLAAKMLARFYVRWGWGYILGPLCRLRQTTLSRLRNYPLLEGARHKQLALDRVGVLQALRFGSEGGIDASNLPYSLVSLPLEKPGEEAAWIFNGVLRELGCRVVVLIVDSDKTYSLRGFHWSPAKISLPGVYCRGGVIPYLVGRIFKLQPQSTPKALHPPKALRVEEALEVAEFVHRVRGHGAGKTVWDMTERFRSEITEVSWEMLESAEHYPIVIVRRSGARGPSQSPL